jgi:hypothetical protein
MPQLLLELFSEEIPARMQGNAARDLERMARDGLAKAGLISEGLKAFAGPRRLTLVVEGLPVAQPDVSEEVKGPRVGAPDQAMDGFLRKTGLTREAAGRARRRLLRPHPQVRPADGGDHRRAGRADRPRLRLAQVDDLGPRQAALGAAAAADPLRVQPRDRAAGGRRHRRRATSARGTGSSARPASSARAISTSTTRPCRATSSCWTSRSASSASSRALAPCASRAGWSWSRTRGCWKRWRAWPNGRPRSSATWTRPSSTCRRR